MVASKPRACREGFCVPCAALAVLALKVVDL
jgi:hypothetical protein